MAVQIGLGADVIMAFDECTEYPAEPERLRSSMEMTLRWAKRSKKYFEEHKHEVPWGGRQSSAVSGSQQQISQFVRNDNQEHVGTAALDRPGERSSPAADSDTAEFKKTASSLGEELRSSGQEAFNEAEFRSAWTAEAAACTQALFGIVQGGMDLQLRKESAERTVEIGFPGYAIGGLSVGEPRHVTREVVEATIEHLPKDKPRYLMGVGTPEEIADYANLGIDMMDCVLPTRAARHGLLFTSEGKVSIKQARYAGDEGALDPNCTCRVCRRYSRAYLRHLYASNEVLAQVLNSMHNLSFYLDTMRRVRDAISLGDRARVHSGVRSARRS
jgi:queuine tRNA-ribosyltransferase